MSKYLIYIKSSVDAPDYEAECEAKSKKEAVKIFTNRINVALSQSDVDGEFWSEDAVSKYVMREGDTK